MRTTLPLESKITSRSMEVDIQKTHLMLFCSMVEVGKPTNDGGFYDNDDVSWNLNSHGRQHHNVQCSLFVERMICGCVLKYYKILPYKFMLRWQFNARERAMVEVCSVGCLRPTQKLIDNILGVIFVYFNAIALGVLRKSERHPYILTTEIQSSINPLKPAMYAFKYTRLQYKKVMPTYVEI